MTTHSTWYNEWEMQPPLSERAAALLLPDEQAVRYRLYITLAALLYTAAWMLVLARAHVRHTSVDFAVSDARGYYIYLPTIVIDADLRFGNQLQTQIGPDVQDHLAVEEARGGWEVSEVRNRWPIGVAVAVAPGFLLGHGLSHALYALSGSEMFTPNGYTALYFVFCVANVMVIGTLGMIAADRLLTERYNLNGRCVAAGILTWWLGSNFLWFWLREPLVAHLVGASCILIAVYLIHRIEAETRPTRGADTRPSLRKSHLPLVALVVSLALACRFSNAFIIPVLVYFGVILVSRRLIGQAMAHAHWIVLAMTPMILQALALYVMNGQVVPESARSLGYTREERFLWTDPALVLSLFSTPQSICSRTARKWKGL